MKILYIVPYAPTPIRTRPYNLLRALSELGHIITLATLWENEAELDFLKELKSSGIRVIHQRLTHFREMQNALSGMLSSQPIQAWYSWHPNLARLAEAIIRQDNFNIIHIEHLRGVRYGCWLMSRFRDPDLEIPVVWDSVDCISSLFEQAAEKSQSLFGKWMTRIELPRTRRFEADSVNRFDRVLVTSEQDKIGLEKLAREKTGFAQSRIRVLTNGVDTSFFSPDSSQTRDTTIVFSGKLSYHANVTAARFLAEHVMPLVWANHPEASLEFVGKDPHPSLHRLARSDTRIRLFASVPDIRPYLRRGRVAAAPLIYGTGIQNKVLEAMACGTPVVATSRAVAALTHLKPGRDALIGDSKEELAEAISLLLNDRDRCRSIGERGLEYIRQFHDWKVIANDLISIYSDLIR